MDEFFGRIVGCPRALYAACFQIFDEKNHGNKENKPITAAWGPFFVSIDGDSCASCQWAVIHLMRRGGNFSNGFGD